MLIGGGDVGRGNTAYETKEIDEEIVKMTGKDNPNFLFIGLASSFSDSYYDTMKKIYKDLGCTPVYLKKKNILHNPDLVATKIKEADIIYFCGGDTEKLLQDITSYNIIPLLKEKAQSDVVFAGMSAGAILFCRQGFSDYKILNNTSTDYEFITGLGFLDINFCPHYEQEKRLSLKKHLENTSLEVYALENKTALQIIDKTYSIIKSDSTKKAYLCSYQKNKYSEKSL